MKDKKNNNKGTFLIIFFLIACVFIKVLLLINANTLKEKEALDLIMQKYNNILDITSNKNDYNFSNEIIIDNKKYNEILNYKKIIDINFTKNGKNQFQKYYSNILLEKNNKIYIDLMAKEVCNPTYKELERKINGLTYEITCDSNVLIIKMKKINNVWLIDDIK